MTTVSFKGVGKVYPGGTRAVTGLDLAIEDGELLVLVGPSGCGKTTILRMTAGLEEVTEGEIRIGDEIVNTVDPSRRDVAMVFQNYALYPHMTVFDNLAFPLRAHGLPRDEIRRRVERTAALLQLDGLLKRKPRALSGGQRQRVAMGRAIVREPKAFLMDEPLSNLDASLRTEVRTEIAALQRELGVTTLYVTHDQLEAMTMGSRIAVLRDGILQQVGPPRSLYEAPNNLFVATFLGSPRMNVLPGRIVEDGGSRFWVLGEQRLELGGNGRAAGLAGEVVVGVRPEHLTDNWSADRPRLRGLVRSVELIGSEQLVHVEVPGGDALVTARFDASTAVDAGAPVELAVTADRLHFFDAATGSAIAR